MPEIYKVSMTIEFTCLHDTDKLVLHMNNDNLKLDNSSLRLFIENFKTGPLKMHIIDANVLTCYIYICTEVKSSQCMYWRVTVQYIIKH